MSFSADPGPRCEREGRRSGSDAIEDYIDLGEVRTWYDERGQGDPLALLHPGMADARAFAPNIHSLAGRFHVYTPERRGHGHTPDVDGAITFELMAADTVAFLETVVEEPAHLVGCSDGATVALLVALQRPELVRRLALVAGVFHHDGWVPQAIDPENDLPAFMAHSYGEVSPDGRDHFPVVAGKLAQMHLEDPALTAAQLATVARRTLVMVGDDDEVTLEHAVAAYRAIPDSELAVVPGTSHGLLVEKPELCNRLIIDFLATEPVPTLAPIRRAPS
jgi:pimeloyl-ACP methyl ester carboxylesterase